MTAAFRLTVFFYKELIEQEKAVIHDVQQVFGISKWYLG